MANQFILEYEYCLSMVGNNHSQGNVEEISSLLLDGDETSAQLEVKGKSIPISYQFTKAITFHENDLSEESYAEVNENIFSYGDS